MKVMTIVGTRPEIIKLSRVISELDSHTDHVLVHTGQNFDFELNEVFFQQLGIRKPDYFLGAAKETTAETIAAVIAESDKVYAEVSPEALLILGDTNSCLSVIPAKRRKIPIFHMEAGNRCFDQRVPEEINRKIVDHISDINLTYTEHARRYLLAEGLRPETVIKTGSPMKEILEFHQDGIESSDVLDRLGLEMGAYFIVSMHREENVDIDDHLIDLLAALEAIAKHYKWPVIVSTHPRTRNRMKAIGYRSSSSEPIRFMKPLGFYDYIKLQTRAACVISDSGTITEEASILNFPAITIRQTHERPEGMDEGTVVMSGLEQSRILQSIAIVCAHASHSQRPFRLVKDYDTDNVSKKVVRIILSYTDYVNRTVWCKND